jgi:hypothetical protein
MRKSYDNISSGIKLSTVSVTTSVEGRVNMNTNKKLRPPIDKRNKELFDTVHDRLKFEALSEDAIEWIMMEHYQFSLRNTEFLLIGTNTTQDLTEVGVTKELRRHFDEELNHATWYRKGLKEIGTNVVGKHVPFQATTEFFHKIRQLVSTEPSIALGTLYATEGAAIYEGVVFTEANRKVSEHRHIDYDRTSLKNFHDIHLEGVEQSHIDGLGVFVDPVNSNDAVNTDGASLKIDRDKVETGAHQALDAMFTWWDAMLTETAKINQ